MSQTTSNTAVPIHELALAQLNGLKEQLEKEIELFQVSYAQLKAAQDKFLLGQRSLSEFNPENKDCEVLIPLTSSVYVPGKMADIGKVMVDVGTGYFMEKSVEEAKEYYGKKSAYLKEQLDSIQQSTSMKQDTLSAIYGEMQRKASPKAAPANPSGGKAF